jgi:hypothetical protein
MERTLDSPLDDTNMTNTRAYTRAYTPSAIEIVASTGKNTYGRASTIVSNAIRSSKLVYSNLHTCTFANSSILGLKLEQERNQLTCAARRSAA